MANVIVAERLTKSYGRRRGVIDLDFAVPPGEVFGYLGPNGAGKTTTIRTMLDLIRPTSGRVTVFGLDPRQESVEIHRRIGYLPGELALYDGLTGGEYLAHIAALRGSVDPKYAAELVDRFGLDPTVKIRSLSHGNKQKVGLVQAFMHRPELLVLDEPTLGLDPLMQQAFHRLIADVRAEGGTVFLSSHVLPEVERLCDRVAIIRTGRMVAVEDVVTLKSRATREIELRFASPIPADTFARVDAVDDAIVTDAHARLRVRGSVDSVIKAAARYEVLDVSAREPTLEEIFLAFYGEEDGGR
jgi:ABC-2 type transport system ATP-binding protein